MGEVAINDNLQPGGSIEVRSRFDRSWARGFEVAEVTSDGYRIRRVSDGSVLPAVFQPDDVRQVRPPSPGLR